MMAAEDQTYRRRSQKLKPSLVLGAGPALKSDSMETDVISDAVWVVLASGSWSNE